MSKRDFKIHCICLVKNEADIIECTLRSARTWADKIYVYDNQSTDGTWEIAQSLADDVIVPWKQTNQKFLDGLRSDVFNEFKKEMRPNDWWCRLDGDEIYIDSPREFLAEIPLPFHVVWGVPITYRLTEYELANLDFTEPMESRMHGYRHYQVPFSEIRFCRHRNGLEWDQSMSWPRHVGPVWKKRIRFKHFQYRSMEQIEKRVADRLEAMKNLPPDYWWSNYRNGVASLITKSDECYYDDGSGQYPYDEAKLPRLRPALPRFLAQYVLHGLRIWK